MATTPSAKHTQKGSSALQIKRKPLSPQISQPDSQPNNKKKQTDTKKAYGHATSEMQQLREDVFFSAVVVAVVAVG